MSSGTGIQWSDATWNPVVGCTRASAGCDHCYAVTMTHRLEAMGQEKYRGLTVLNQNGDRHFNGVVRCVEEDLQIPLHWKKPRRVFVNSMSDLFHKDVPFDFIDRVFAVMALCPQHTFQILTKRPERMAAYLDQDLDFSSYHRTQDAAAKMGWITKGEGFRYAAWAWPLPNVWLGTSVENRDVLLRADELRKSPAAIRFLSLEPLIGPLGEIDLSGIGWVIVGGESGRGSRPCEAAWIRSIIEQCETAGVPCFTKQLGSVAMDVPPPPPGGRYSLGERPGQSWRLCLRDSKGGDINEWPADLRVRQFPRPPVEAKT